MNIEDKRKIILENLENFEKFLLEYKPGLKNKLIRNVKLLKFSPILFLDFIIFKFIPIRKKIRLFNLRDIVLTGGDNNSAMMFFGFLKDLAEIKTTKFFIKNLKDSDIFYDVGANYGFYTYLALEFCKEVHCFEPIPECCENLRFNLSKEDRVFINEVAVSSENGFVEIVQPGKSPGLSSINKEIIKSFTRANLRKLKKYKVKSIKLDDYIFIHKPPSIIKIDVEGAEEYVLRGGKEFFVNNSPIIVMEIRDKKMDGEVSMRAVNLLRNWGYKSYFINENGELTRKDGDLSIITNVFDNFVFMK